MDSRVNQQPATSLSSVVPRSEPHSRFNDVTRRARDFWRRVENKLARVTSDRRRVRLFRALTPLRLTWAYLYDARRFGRAAHLTNAFKNRRTAGAHLLRGAHALEKGQALPAPRPGFGADKIRELFSDTARYHRQFGCDEV